MQIYSVKENGMQVWKGQARSKTHAIKMAYAGITDDDCGDLSLSDLLETVTVERQDETMQHTT